MRDFGYYWVRSKIDAEIIERDELKDPFNPWEVMYFGPQPMMGAGDDTPVAWFSVANELYSDADEDDEDWIGLLGPRIEPPK